MSKRYQGTLDGFRPRANPQPESPPSSTDYMLMLKGLITSAKADISAVIDPKHLTSMDIEWAIATTTDRETIGDFDPTILNHVTTFCTDVGRFYADLQASALESGNNDVFVDFGRKSAVANLLQNVFLSLFLRTDADARAALLPPELRRG